MAAPDYNALAQAHMRAQVAEAAKVQLALAELWERTIDPADIAGSFAKFQGSAASFVGAGRTLSESTAQRYFLNIKTLAEVDTPTPAIARQALKHDIIEGSLSASTAKARARAERLVRRGESPAVALATAKANMLGSAKRQVLNGGRGRLVELALKDKSFGAWARVSDGKPCKFCALLVSRGPVYTGEGVGFRAHDRCGCSVRPVPKNDPSGGWSDDALAYRAAYKAANGDVGKFGAAIAGELQAAPLNFLARVQTAAAKLPADRASIGVKLSAPTANSADYNRAASKVAEREFGTTRLTLMETEERYLEGIRQNDDWLRHLAKAETWDDLPSALVDELRREGFIVFPTYTPAMVRGGLVARGEALRKYADESTAKLNAFRARVADIRENHPELLAMRADDLDELGNLGAKTREALDAVLEAGTALDEELTRRLAPIMARIDELDAPVASAKARYDALRTSGASFSDQLPAYEAYLEASKVAGAAKAELWLERRDVVRNLLAEVRPLGGGARSTYNKTRGKLKDAIMEAHKNYPDDWNDRVAALFPNVELRQVKRGYNASGQIIALSTDTGSWARTGAMGRIATHELGHSMEKVDGVRGLEWAFHYHRSEKVVGADGVTALAPEYDIYGKNIGMGAELANPGEWASAYIGKTYRSRGGVGAENSWEVFTMGAESLFDASGNFTLPSGADDAEFRRFILGVLATV